MNDLHTNTRIGPETASYIPGGMFLLGALSIIGLYHLGISVFRKNETAPFYIFVYCLLFGIRLLFSSSEPYFSFIAEMSEPFRMKIANLALYICVPVYSALMRDLYPEEMSPRYHRYNKYLFILIAILILLLPDEALENAYRLSFIPITVFVIYCATTSARALSHKREGALLGNIGGKTFGVTVMNDILYLNGYITTGQIAYWGLLFLIICQSLILSMRLSHTFKTNHVLQRLSIIDGLTNLYNRRYLDQKLHELREKAKRDDKFLSVIMLDIDFFKIFNDSYGHLAGDDCLIKVAGVLQTYNTNECHAFRYGGEELIVALIAGQEEQAYELGESIRKKIEELNIEHIGSPFGSVTVSGGIATIKPGLLDDNWDIKNLVSKADHSLYQAKRNGRNRTVLFSQS